MYGVDKDSKSDSLLKRRSARYASYYGPLVPGITILDSTLQCVSQSVPMNQRYSLENTLIIHVLL